LGWGAGVSGVDGEGGGEISSTLKGFTEKFSVAMKTVTCNYLHLATIVYKPLGECQLFGDFVDIGRGDVNRSYLSPKIITFLLR